MFMYIACSVHVYMCIINSINSEKRGGGRLAIYIKIHPWAFTRAEAFARAVTVINVFSVQTDGCFLMENGLVRSNFLGVQEHFLADMRTSYSPDALVEPDAMFGRCLQAALVPRAFESTSLQTHKRECLLSVALDYSVTSFFRQCIEQFSSPGKYTFTNVLLPYFPDQAPP